MKDKKGLSDDLLMLFIVFATTILNFFGNSIIANHTSAQLYGDYSLALRILGIVSILSLLGTNSVSQIFLHHFLVAHNLEKNKLVKRFVHWNIKLIFVPHILCWVVGLAVFLSILIFHAMGVKPFFSYPLFLHMIWLAPFMGLSVLCASYIQCKDKPILSYILRVPLKRLLTFINAVLLVYVLNWPINAQVLIGSFVVIALGGFFVNFITAKVHVPEVFTLKIQGLLRKRLPVDQDWHKKAVDLSFNNIIFLLLCSMDMVLVKIIVPEASAVGYYSACCVVAGVVWLVPTAAYMPLSPAIRQGFEGGLPMAQLQKNINQSIFFSVAASLAIVALICAFSDQILSFFGPNYVQSKTTLLVLCVGGVLGSVSGVAVKILVYAKETKKLLSTSVMEFITTIVFGSVCTYFWGILGTAIGSTISIFIKAMRMVYLARKASTLKSFFIV